MGFFDFLGNVFGMKSQENISRDQLATQKGINEQNIAFQRETNAQNIEENRYLMERQIGAQEAAAKSAIQWRVADAASAGIHPLYAMGNPGISVGPVGVGASSVAPRAEMPQFAPSSTPDFIRGMGQSIDAAIGRQMSKRERVAAVMEANEARGRAIARDMLVTENMSLENELLRTRIANLAGGGSAQVGPPAPTVVDHPSNSSTRVEVQAARPTAASVYDSSREGGSITDYGYTRNSRGGISIVPSNDVRQRIEDQLIPEAMWALRNIHPPFAPPPRVPNRAEFPLPPGQYWQWNPFRQEFQAVRRPTRRHHIGASR